MVKTKIINPLPLPKKKYPYITTPLLPIFNKAKAKMPPWIEKWVLEMQDVHYELINKPGKDKADPFDYLSTPITTPRQSDGQQRTNMQ